MMRLFSYIFTFLSVLVFTDCSCQNNKVESALKECVNQKVNKNIQAAYGKEPFDFYDFILKFEKELISNNLLKNRTKDDYYNLLLSIIDDSSDSKYSKIYTQQNNLMDDYGFSAFSTEAIFTQCPYHISESSKDTEGKIIYAEGNVLNKLMAQGFDDKELLKELINTLDEESFKKEVYRAPIILLVMINIDTKYNPDLQKLKERQKGKKFLNKN
ncbi:hypothetical protein ED312_06505 [Sinomicrobium pectinilyticum]|uniref:Uncharacterized protein n=1 Tax=Sinomicrobium pectinilyticum TaxID=1084421 RepID=A0A3N0EQV2_SINP1|nr:hypothetical protein [Sinomicrobium pectinilyticum]RNL90318.1 hypothetical protein ED312_06505 [Sinomicrobium pectinilyticum]